MWILLGLVCVLVCGTELNSSEGVRHLVPRSFWTMNRGFRPNRPHVLQRYDVGGGSGSSDYGIPFVNQQNSFVPPLVHPSNGGYRTGSPNGGYGTGGSVGGGGHQSTQNNFFPYYLRELFDFKSYIASTKNRLAEGEDTLAVIMDKHDVHAKNLTDIVTCLKTLNGLEAACSALTGKTFVFQNRCLSVYPTDTGDWNNGIQKCLENVGKLAILDTNKAVEFKAAIKTLIDAGDITEGDKLYIGNRKNAFFEAAITPSFGRDGTLTISYICEHKPKFKLSCTFP